VYLSELKQEDNYDAPEKKRQTSKSLTIKAPDREKPKGKNDSRTTGRIEVDGNLELANCSSHARREKTEYLK
jgi:hypothetical protein